MSTRLLSLFIWSVLAGAPLAQAQEKPADPKGGEIVMFVGEVKIIPADRIHRIAVGNGPRKIAVQAVAR